MIKNLEKLTQCDFYNVNVKTQITELQLKVTKNENPKTDPLSKKSCEQNLTVE